jgi:hypothetical protein
MYASTRIGIGLLAVLAVGCGPETTTIRTEPTGAFVKVDGDNKGTAPVTHDFDYRGNRHAVVQATLAGYIPVEQVVDRKETKNGMLVIALEPDPVWAETTESEAANRWLRIHVAEEYDEPEMWKRIVDSVTTRYSVIEQMDPDSGYILSAAETRRFQRTGEMIAIRTKIVGAVSSEQPLIYRIKIVADWSKNGGPWMQYDRVFKDDAELVEELHSRLSIR